MIIGFNLKHETQGMENIIKSDKTEISSTLQKAKILKTKRKSTKRNKKETNIVIKQEPNSSPYQSRDQDDNCVLRQVKSEENVGSWFAMQQMAFNLIGFNLKYETHDSSEEVTLKFPKKSKIKIGPETYNDDAENLQSSSSPETEIPTVSKRKIEENYKHVSSSEVTNEDKRNDI